MQQRSPAGFGNSQPPRFEKASDWQAPGRNAPTCAREVQRGHGIRYPPHCISFGTSCFFCRPVKLIVSASLASHPGKMTTGPALTETQLPPKENSFSSTRLLSKIARSPTTSRRHRPIPSQGSDGIPDPLPVTQGAAHSRRNQPRPTFQRQISAPDTSVLPLSREEEEEEVKRHSDATGLAAEQAKAMLNSQPLHPQQHNNNNNTTAAAKGNAPATMFSAPLVSEYYPVQHTNPNIGPNGVSYMFQQLHELSQKRIATLQYMKRA